MMPVPQNTDGKFNTLLVGGGSKYFFVDNSATEEQQKQAKDFLNWLVTSEAGQDGLVNKCALVPAFTATITCRMITMQSLVVPPSRSTLQVSLIVQPSHLRLTTTGRAQLFPSTNL